MRYWTNKPSGYTPLLAMPSSKSPKILDLNPRTVVDVIEAHIIDGEFEGFLQCLYILGNREYRGWCEQRFLDPYNETLPKNCVDLSGLQTANPNDAEQYIVYGNTTQYNMCGEMCLAFLLNIPLRDMLAKWQQTDLPFFRRVFRWGTSKVAIGTSDGDLVSMFDVYGVKSHTLNQRGCYTPNKLEVGSIVSVHMDKYTGRLNGGGVLHWVVVTGVIQERQGCGLAYVYNPFPNRIEVYSWKEFLASARSPYGAIKEAL